MRICVEHETRYDYDGPVSLGPHLVRLRPRLGGAVGQTEFHLHVEPDPVDLRECLDASGNRVIRLWFSGTTRHLYLLASSDVETHTDLDLAPRLEPAQRALSPVYTDGELRVLGGCLGPVSPGASGADPRLAAMVSLLRAESGDDCLGYLERLNHRLFVGINREIRPSGWAQSPAETLARGAGACRDQTLLFIALCRAVGLAARFVSGYQGRSAMETAERFLHAWPEVYLPGAGWYGYDPTRGIPVAGDHIPLAAGPTQLDTMPVEGYFEGTANSQLTSRLEIRVEEDLGGD